MGAARVEADGQPLVVAVQRSDGVVAEAHALADPDKDHAAIRDLFEALELPAVGAVMVVGEVAVGGEVLEVKLDFGDGHGQYPRAFFTRPTAAAAVGSE